MKSQVIIDTSQPNASIVNCGISYLQPIAQALRQKGINTLTYSDPQAYIASPPQSDYHLLLFPSLNQANLFLRQLQTTLKTPRHSKYLVIVLHLETLLPHYQQHLDQFLQTITKLQPFADIRTLITSNLFDQELPIFTHNPLNLLVSSLAQSRLDLPANPHQNIHPHTLGQLTQYLTPLLFQRKYSGKIVEIMGNSPYTLYSLALQLKNAARQIQLDFEIVTQVQARTSFYRPQSIITLTAPNPADFSPIIANYVNSAKKNLNHPLKAPATQPELPPHSPVKMSPLEISASTRQTASPPPLQQPLPKRVVPKTNTSSINATPSSTVIIPEPFPAPQSSKSPRLIQKQPKTAGSTTQLDNKTLKKTVIARPKRIWPNRKIQAIIITTVIILALIATITSPVWFLRVKVNQAQSLSPQNTAQQVETATFSLEKAHTFFVSAIRRLDPILADSPHNFVQSRLLSLQRQYTRAKQHLYQLHASQKLVQAFDAVIAGKSENPFTIFLEAGNGLLAAYQQSGSSLVNSKSFQGSQLEYLNQLKTHQTLDDARLLTQTLPYLLSPTGTSTYVLLVQNEHELRATGGFVTAAGLISFDQGKLNRIDLKNVYELDQMLKGTVQPPEQLKQFLKEENWYLRDVNWDPDFVSTAKNAEWFIDKELNQHVDGTIAIDGKFLEKVLSKLGSVNVPGHGQIDAPKISSLLLQQNELEQTGQGSDFYLNALINAMVEAYNQSSPATKVSVLAAVLEAAQQNQLQIAPHNQAAFANLTDLGFTGALISPVCPSAFDQTQCHVDYAYLTETNVGINRTNYYLKRDHDHAISITPDNINHRYQLTLQNTAVENKWPADTYRVLIRLYLPVSSRQVAILKNQQPVESAQFSEYTQHGKKVISFYTEVGVGETQTLVFTYHQLLNSNNTTQAYTLLIQKQPGTDADPVVISLDYPSHWQAKRTSPPMTHVLNNLSFVGNLSENLFLAVEF